MINLDYLKTTTNNDQETILALLDIFKSQIPELKLGIISALDRKNYFDLREAAHKAKNSFQILGMQNEANNLHILELLCSQKKDIHLYEGYVNRFIADCKDAVNEINEGVSL